MAVDVASAVAAVVQAGLVANVQYAPTVFSAASGANVLSGASYASTPNAVENRIRGDLDVVAYVTATNWSAGVFQGILGKFQPVGGQRAYTFEVGATGTLHLATSPEGATAIAGDSTAAVGFANGTGGWVRATLKVDDGAGNRVYQFFTSTNAVTTAPGAVVWTQLGTTVTVAGTTTVFPSSAELDVGVRTGSSGVEPFTGTVSGVYLYAGISGTLVDSMVANDNVGKAQGWISALTGEAWSLGGGATVTGNYVAPGVVPAGFVISQSPASGTVVPLNSVVTLVVSTGIGGQLGSVTVPNLVGLTWKGATDVLATSSLSLGKYTFTANAAAPGVVLTQLPASGANVAPGTIVTLTLSAGPTKVAPTVTVPVAS